MWLQNAILTVFVAFIMSILVITLGRWWVFQNAFTVTNEQGNPQVVGYRQDSRLSRVFAFVAFPLTSCYAIMGSAVRSPVAGAGNLGSGGYTLLTFLFVKPFVFYSLIAVPIAIICVAVWLLWARIAKTGRNTVASSCPMCHQKVRPPFGENGSLTCPSCASTISAG